MIEALTNQIPFISNCKKIIQIKKGASSDKKYLINLEDNQKVLLRVFNHEALEAKKAEYSILEKMRDYNVTCSQPISIGKVDNRGYILTTYIEGKDAEDELPLCTEQEQFNIGIEAGQNLRKMHQYTAPSHVTSWYLRKKEKHQKYLDAYLKCEMKIQNDQKIIKFIEENIHLMKQRPNIFQHDDFHVGNIIVNKKKFAGVIDFNRYDWGDPIHEFLKIGIFSRKVSIPFSIGQIQGYYNNTEPEEYFWRLYSLYLAMCVFSTVIWTIKTIPDSIDDMLEKVYLFLEDHDNFRELKPKWYTV
ncbi:aminoglycoside phosphotransferase family protein [Pullulanibacillus sp. KACC 23026]|uniref:aminoglycoside phosphotransferase family protein n=1 Tax=Pullulanibacillus sp. KACC 23026 TaxID=3028315 RepID=UPI0023B14624|nr:aminoglycoside phosphotransferase family protein [Pullulanibacillus sp. KACC 23026]WEG14451.1 aminoglycoside phosphotransferase family protein [Pullulanibacillus sp. KACC 23026]